MTNETKAEAVWCECGRQAFVHVGNETVCPFCFLSKMVGSGLMDVERACRMEAILESRRAEENLRLTSVVFGGVV